MGAAVSPKAGRGTLPPHSASEVRVLQRHCTLWLCSEACAGTAVSDVQQQSDARRIWPQKVVRDNIVILGLLDGVHGYKRHRRTLLMVNALNA